MSSEILLPLLIAIITVFSLYSAMSLATNPLISIIDNSANAFKISSTRLKIISQDFANSNNNLLAIKTTYLQPKSRSFSSPKKQAALLSIVAIIGILTLCSENAIALDPLVSSIETAASALKAQSERLKIIAQNIANEDSTGLTAGAAPYRRKLVLFKRKKGLDKVERIVTLKPVPDKKDFKKRYDPTHPASDQAGYVLYPNVDKTIEFVDAKEAQRSYEANLNTIEISKSMMARTMEILK
jgi:flagellar basal-body rod protein FlgC